jgi:hypothetical protein
MQKKILFSKNLHHYLKKAGYTHIQLQGICAKNEFPIKPDNTYNYFLVPWKVDIDYKFGKSNFQMEEINSTDITVPYFLQ